MIIDDRLLFAIAPHTWLFAWEQALVFLVLHLDFLQLAFIHQVVLTRIDYRSCYGWWRLDVFWRRRDLVMINRRWLVIAGDWRWRGCGYEFIHDLVSQTHFVFSWFLFVLVELNRSMFTSSSSLSFSNCFLWSYKSPSNCCNSRSLFSFLPEGR